MTGDRVALCALGAGRGWLILLSQVGKVVYDSQVPYTCEAAESIDA